MVFILLSKLEWNEICKVPSNVLMANDNEDLASNFYAVLQLFGFVGYRTSP